MPRQPSLLRPPLGAVIDRLRKLRAEPNRSERQVVVFRVERLGKILERLILSLGR
jgi:hypothetical protein